MADENENLDEKQLDLALDNAKNGVKEPEIAEEEAPSQDDAIAELRKQLEAEKQARLEAENRAREAARTANQATNETHSANLNLVNSAIERFKGEQEVLKANYRNALAAGDHDAAAEYNMAISENAAKLLQLESGKTAMQQEAEQRKNQPVIDDPVEAFASRLSPRSADWVRRHPQFVTDTRLNQKMIAAHNLAVADGHRPDTDDYFGALEGILLPQRRPQREIEANNDDEGAMSEAAKPTQRRSAPPPAAPPSRGSNEPGRNTGRITLTPEMREMARNMGMTDEQYAVERQRLVKEGRISG